MDYDHWPDLLTDSVLLSESDMNPTRTFLDGSYSPGNAETSKNRHQLYTAEEMDLELGSNN